MSIRIEYIQQIAENAFNERVEFAESIILHKGEIVPYPITDELYKEVFGNAPCVTVLSAANDDDGAYITITEENADQIICIEQDGSGEFNILGKYDL